MEFILAIANTPEERDQLNAVYDDQTTDQFKGLAVCQGQIIVGLHFRGKRPTKIVDLTDPGARDADWFRECVIPAAGSAAEFIDARDTFSEHVQQLAAENKMIMHKIAEDLKVYAVLDWIAAKFRK